MPTSASHRPRLDVAGIVAAACALADDTGIEALSMRTLAQRLGVVPMALYKHVRDKEHLLDLMIAQVIAEFSTPAPGTHWRASLRGRILSARATLLRHRWAAGVIASRQRPTTGVLEHLDAVAADLLAGGLSPALVHQGLHALGTRVWGFTLEVFPSSPPPDDPAARAVLLQAFGAAYPRLAQVAAARTHDPASIVGDGCDDQFEFEFALDLMLDGLERLQARSWPSNP